MASLNQCTPIAHLFCAPCLLSTATPPTYIPWFFPCFHLPPQKKPFPLPLPLRLHSAVAPLPAICIAPLPTSHPLAQTITPSHSVRHRDLALERQLAKFNCFCLQPGRLDIWIGRNSIAHSQSHPPTLQSPPYTPQERTKQSGEKKLNCSLSPTLQPTLHSADTPLSTFPRTSKLRWCEPGCKVASAPVPPSACE